MTYVVYCVLLVAVTLGHFDFQIRYSSDESTSLHYCEQVTLEEYENQKLTSSQQAIATLLEELVNDKSMAAKEKRKRLKQVRKHVVWQTAVNFLNIQTPQKIAVIIIKFEQCGSTIQ